VKSGLCWTVFARNRDTAVPAEGNGDLQTLICVLVARPRRCLTLSNGPCPVLSRPVPWQNWMAAYLGYTLRIRTLFRGWPIMVNDTHTRRRRRSEKLSDFDEIWYTTSDIEPITVTWQKIEIFKIQDGCGRHLENRFFGHKSSTDCPISSKFCMKKQNGRSTRAKGQKLHIFKIQDGGRPPF